MSEEETAELAAVFQACVRSVLEAVERIPDDDDEPEHAVATE